MFSIIFIVVSVINIYPKVCDYSIIISVKSSKYSKYYNTAAEEKLKLRILMDVHNAHNKLYIIII